ncbi:MAG: integrase arm-type DNA-binding domain-containing protein [Aquamicrobium sp.]|uniref:integrase arm-type DNA-binding domain-containing protein n=1 Tax=Aquamicrobium sp. TaxID=1872579 RepID=UPI00349EDCEF|nr:integrase arm-type DNA-binding domain-containing protein [Aquamicrobium sp.]
MPSKRADIGPSEVQEARAAAAARSHSSRDPLIIADDICRGLSLRVQGGSASWVLKFSGHTRSLGSVAEIRTAKAARELAAHTRALMRSGEEVKSYVRSRQAGRSHQDAAAKVSTEQARAAGRWTWEDLATQYADVYLSSPRITTRGVLKQPSLATAAEARRYLMMEEASGLFGRLLSELRPGDLEEVRDACARAGRKTGSRQFVAYAKGALSFARKKHSRSAGLEGAPKWWLEVEKLDSTIPSPRSRLPSLKELATVLYRAERYRVMPGRDSGRKTSETVICALWWLALTAQRASAGLSIRRAHVLPWPNGPEGWKVAYFPSVVMKGKRPHSVPIPPRVSLLFDRALWGADEESQYVFPALRLMGEKVDAPLSRSAPKLLLDRLRGRPANLEAARAPQEAAAASGEVGQASDLLEGITYFTPHDIRRTFATVCADLAVRGDAISAVLDHADVSTGQAPMVSADITRIAYDYSQRLELKRLAIEAWTDALFAACDAEWASHQPRRSAFQKVPPPRPTTSGKVAEIRFTAAEPWYRTIERAKAQRVPSLRLSSIALSRDDADF